MNTRTSSKRALLNTISCLPGVLPGSKSVFYHLHSIWLFTRSDLKTIVGPSALFAVSNAAARCNSIEPLTRIPLVIFWIWMNLLPFDIGNQRSSSAIAEDLLNKPWRPLPSGRLTQKQARIIMIVAYASAIFASSQTGGLRQCLALIALGTWYNDFGGADYNAVVRNLINAFGYLSFISGALEIALPASLTPFDDRKTAMWLLILGGIIWTTVHAQDLADQEGDSARGRKTVPLEMGDLPARIIIFIGVPLWSVICLRFWAPPAAITCAHLALCTLVAWRTYNLRSARQDSRTFKYWNLWIGSTYILPLCAALSKTATA